MVSARQAPRRIATQAKKERLQRTDEELPSKSESDNPARFHQMVIARLQIIWEPRRSSASVQRAECVIEGVRRELFKIHAHNIEKR